MTPYRADSDARRQDIRRICFRSPASKRICYFSGQSVNTRPEGVLWEMDVEEALARLEK